MVSIITAMIHERIEGNGLEIKVSLSAAAWCFGCHVHRVMDRK